VSRHDHFERRASEARIELLDPDPIVRLRAVDEVGFDAAGLYALRDRLLDDRSGLVRAAAARRSRSARRVRASASATRSAEACWSIRRAVTRSSPSRQPALSAPRSTTRDASWPSR
jgi:hypothetical protein